MSIGDAARFREGYFAAYPGIRAWHRQVRDQLAEGGKVQTPCGRWSRFPKEGDPSLPGAAAHVIQGAEAEVIQATLGRLLDALRGLDSVPLACIHDEVILDVAEADVPAAEVAVREAMERGMRDVFPKAPLIKLVEAKHGASWGAAK
jgi:DNA polymerase-1